MPAIDPSPESPLGELPRACATADQAPSRPTEGLFRSMVESSLEGIVVLQDLVIRYANPALAQMFGYGGAAELIGCDLWQTLVAPEERPEDEPDPPPADRPGGTETILLVEDEDGVRDLVCRILRQRGYTVLETSHPRDALRTCVRPQGPIHLLLTDVVLPELSGRDVARRLAPSVPGMKVLYMSGHTGSVVLQQGVLAAEGSFLPKPFTPEVLLCKVRAVLDR